MSDTIVSYTANPKLSLAFNSDYGQDTIAGQKAKGHGLASYLKYQATDWFALSPRVEYCDATDGFTTGVPQKAKEFTLTTEFKHKDGVLIGIEYRGDFSDAPLATWNVSGLSRSAACMFTTFHP